MGWQQFAHSVESNDVQSLLGYFKDVSLEQMKDKIINGDIPIFMWNKLHQEAQKTTNTTKLVSAQLKENKDSQKVIKQQIEELQKKQSQLEEEEKNFEQQLAEQQVLADLLPFTSQIKQEEKTLITNFSKKIAKDDWSLYQMKKDDICVAFNLLNIGEIVSIFSMKKWEGEFCEVFLDFESIANVLPILCRKKLNYLLYLLSFKQFPFLHDDCSICLADPDESFNILKEHKISLDAEDVKLFSNFSVKEFLFLSPNDFETILGWKEKSFTVLVELKKMKMLHESMFFEHSVRNLTSTEWGNKFLSFGYDFSQSCGGVSKQTDSANDYARNKNYKTAVSLSSNGGASMETILEKGGEGVENSWGKNRERPSWFQITYNFSIIPTEYELRHEGQVKNSFMSSWKVFGEQEGKWVLLKAENSNPPFGSDKNNLEQRFSVLPTMVPFSTFKWEIDGDFSICYADVFGIINTS